MNTPAMKILYGVVGEGMGHAIRSSVVLEKLIGDGHEVHVVVSGHAHAFLSERFPQVSRIWGLSMAMSDNAVQNRSTLAKNIKGALSGFPQNIQQYLEIEADFKPDVVLSDFESWSWLFAKRHDLPLICIDNIQIINRCEHSAEIIGADRAEFKLTRSIVKAKCPGASHYLVTTFFRPPIRKPRTTLVAPILRPALLAATPRRGEHLLVYQSSTTSAALPGLLNQLPLPVIVYGVCPELTEPLEQDNLTYKPFSEQAFIEDLASCRAVVASSGFTLMSEALHLKKPYLATPIRKQFEQLLNSRYLAKMGLGSYATRLDLDTLQGFLSRLDEFDRELEVYPALDNQQLFGELDALLDQAAAGLL